MDQLDKRILQVLQHQGKLQNNELAQQVGLSASPCLRRVKQLEDEGYIEKYVALLNPQKLNLGLTVFARIWLKGQDANTVNSFVEAIQDLQEVVECQLMAGDCDFFLRIVVADLDAYRRFQVEHLNKIISIQSVKTEIPLQRIKQTTALPL
ncbi:winged helix-turn-helix transcriptional regulator [Acinetobacter cumulans]|jgi:Lrp/AsnC family leucine-responsive transcriptional regulator|uniref:Winged helix-turn-helix transcriptional regulator n=1 Tax=Acinetobacter cumulans TaxID=2136182 RepID=A0A3A8G6V1_9GAMM|nr:MULTISPECIES: Lrp/AsnC family transcriptional regulator [Acinetobacter]NWK76218.1 Lrp/AsnC family transcriptional regulator [Acinetobacter sp. SwsAc6]RFS29266.1 Lrp/AsnC family transcriptional regulator [Acinetobacter sp. SWAC5]RKG41781.1 winged helix-turn-helix transcriptional regulator [Acinetobacter cumulans]RKG47166.1 winged helix-turn-helix transcriptional regulator [Acinetobacter cumulans]RKG50970.1 winged helix-turn-helix transcriptional regulator [Acinetobacter cumulans]